MTEQDRNETIQEEVGSEGGGPEYGQPSGGPESDGPAGREDPAADAMTGTDAAGGDGSGDSAGSDGGEVDELRRELESLNDRHLRLAAEFDNYRKRNQRDRQALASRLQADLVGSLLDVLDDLQRVATDDDIEAEGVLEGVRLVEKKMMTVLEGAGLSTVDAEGSRFDPELMEALGTVPTDDPELDGQVADVFQRGYRLRDMLLRPARVRVYQHSENE